MEKDALKATSGLITKKPASGFELRPDAGFFMSRVFMSACWPGVEYDMCLMLNKIFRQRKSLL
jgi:hypothetical protein